MSPPGTGCDHEHGCNGWCGFGCLPKEHLPADHWCTKLAADGKPCPLPQDKEYGDGMCWLHRMALHRANGGQS